MLTEAGFAVGDLTVNGASGVSEVCPDAASTTTTGGDWTLEFALNECGTTHAPTSTDSVSEDLNSSMWYELNTFSRKRTYSSSPFSRMAIILAHTADDDAYKKRVANCRA